MELHSSVCRQTQLDNNHVTSYHASLRLLINQMIYFKCAKYLLKYNPLIQRKTPSSSPKTSKYPRVIHSLVHFVHSAPYALTRPCRAPDDLLPQLVMYPTDDKRRRLTNGPSGRGWDVHSITLYVDFGLASINSYLTRPLLSREKKSKNPTS